MGHSSNRTLVRVLRLGGAKRRFIAAARHERGACEAQKRPAGPIVSRSPTSFVFNDVVGLDLFFLNTYEGHTSPAMNIVCWGTGLQRVIPLQDQSGETLRNAYRNNWLRSYGRPRILVVDQQRSLCSGIFAESGKRWDETRSDTAGGPVEKWQDRTCRQGLEGRLLQDDTRRPRSIDMDRF